VSSRTRGFSLLELLIVITVILIIAAIAIPRLLTVKQMANSAAAVANLRSLDNALTAYSTQYPAVGYPATMAALAGTGTTPSSTSALLTDTLLAGATAPDVAKQNYYFTYAPGSGTPVLTYGLNATPVGGTVSRTFFTDQTGEIHFHDGAAASVGDPLIG